MRKAERMTPRTYPGRDKARLIRRAKSIQRHHANPANERAHCCDAPDHVEQRNSSGLATLCRNCGAVV